MNSYTTERRQFVQIDDKDRLLQEFTMLYLKAAF